jgi:5-methyltetrahydrofolate--homocysteine methyltransferase
MRERLRELYESVVSGDMNTVREKTERALAEGIVAERLLNGALVPAMAEVGRRFEKGDYFMPEMLVSARAMQRALDVLRPQLVSAGVRATGRVVIGTVKGDLHDIGKNLVSMMLEGAGFEVVDLGVDVAPERFVEAVQSGSVDIVAMSALLTTTVPNMRTTIAALERAGVRQRVCIIVGGAPLTELFAREIGADGFAPDASRAARLALGLVNG